jgi:hypothetical protein
MHHSPPVQATSKIPIIKYATMILVKRLFFSECTYNCHEQRGAQQTTLWDESASRVLNTIRSLDEVEYTMPDCNAEPNRLSGCCISDNTRRIDLDKT